MDADGRQRPERRAARGSTPPSAPEPPRAIARAVLRHPLPGARPASWKRPRHVLCNGTTYTHMCIRACSRMSPWEGEAPAEPPSAPGARPASWRRPRHVLCNGTTYTHMCIRACSRMSPWEGEAPAEPPSAPCGRPSPWRALPPFAAQQELRPPMPHPARVILKRVLSSLPAHHPGARVRRPPRLRRPADRRPGRGHEPSISNSRSGSERPYGA